MAAIDFKQFHELVEEFSGEMPLKKICEQEGVVYRTYIAWRSRMGLSKRRKALPEGGGLVEIEARDIPSAPASSAPMATAIHIEFENGLKFDRPEMEVDALVEFLTKIRSALCLG